MLDANGQLTVTLPTQIDRKHTDQDYRIEARVTDAANREVAGHSTVLATYGSFRLSVEPTSYVVQAGQPTRVKVTAQDYDGKPVQTKVHIAAALEKWDSVTHGGTTRHAGSKDAVTGADGTVLVDLALSGSGDFEVKATAQTPENRTVEDSKPTFGSGTAQARGIKPTRRRKSSPTKNPTSVGDTAHLLLVTRPAQNRGPW